MANRPIEHVYVNDTTYDVKDIYAERSENKASAFSAVPGDTKFPTEKLVKDNLDLKENAANKITSFTGITPTDTQYPSAKLVKDTIDQVVTDLGGSIDGIDFTPYERHANRVSVFQATPDDTHYPSEKLVKDNLDALSTGVSNVRTVVVSALPAIADASETVNYVLYTSGLALLYKKIDGAWVLISGSKAYVGDNLPSTGDIFTEYYIPNPTGDNYLHYRWADPIAADPEHGTEAVPGRFYAIGSDAYSKAEVDAILADYEVLSNKVTSITSTSTDTQYPSAKAVYTSLQSLQSALEGKVEDSTQVVSSVPAAVSADENVNYVVKQGNGALLYRKIDGEMKMVGGAMVRVVSELPEDLEGNPVGDAFTDYYVGPDTDGLYLHYRWSDSDSDFYQVGADAYSKTQIDNKLSEIRQNHTTDVSGINEAIAGHTERINDIASDVEELQGQEKYYHIELTQDENQDYWVNLLVGEGEGDAVMDSNFKLPATGGGGGGSSAMSNLTVQRVTSTPISVTPTDRIVMQANITSVETEGGNSLECSYSLRLGSTTVMSGIAADGLNTFDVTQYCRVGSQRFILTVTDESGTTGSTFWTVQMIDVRLESSFNDRYTYSAGSTVRFPYTPYGATDKTLHVKLDGTSLPDVNLPKSVTGVQQSLDLAARPHGAHLLEAWITATINNVALETEHIFKDIIWYDDTSAVPVIGCAYRYEYYGNVPSRQYNSLAIPYVVYDPTTASPTVEFYVDDVLVDTQTLSTAANTWTYKTSVAAVHNLKIKCKDTFVEVRVDVDELGYDINPVTANLEFDFNPSGYTNASTNRLWTDENHPSVQMSVSDNFDWSNGGYQTDSDGNRYFCVKSGTRAYISYNLFGTNPKQNGAEFKVIFKTEAVQNKDATFLSSMGTITTSEIDEETGEEIISEANIGLEMLAHEANVHTSSGTLYMPYSEEDIIEYEYNINALDLEDDNATSYIMGYEDGVGSRALIYDNGHIMHHSRSVPITIGSDECDVHIYRMKAYSTALTDTDILTNFYADARDAETMIQRYERNQIYENGVLNPEYLATVCPDLKIIMISCPHFTNDKKDYVKYTDVECIHVNGDPIYDNWKFTNGYHAGQGTTSNEYGFSGRNIDIIFGFDGQHSVVGSISENDVQGYVSTLTLGRGTTTYTYTGADAKVSLKNEKQQDGTVKQTSVPNNWFNIKVNIASSENANNALLQKRYNDYLPYKTPAQRRDPRIKNTMEFVNCVVFVKETDPNLANHREFQNTDWNFYAIGNIGDSKKTDNTRVNDPTDMSEFVVEISDNGMPSSDFGTGVYNSDGSYRWPISRSEWNGTNGYSEVTDETLLNIKNLDHLYEKNGNTYRLTSDDSIDNSKQYYMVNYTNPKYRALYVDEYRYDAAKGKYNQISGWDASFEFRYDMGTKDGVSISDAELEQQQLVSKQVFRNMYEFIILSSNSDFVAHFGDWFITESPLYWYLFIERWTMIDNRSKNSFWHWGKVYITAAEAEELGDDNINEDGNEIYIVNDAAAAINNGYRFDMWNYDDDTAMGINNSGELVFPYGYEFTDLRPDGGSVFNEYRSVFWDRIRVLMADRLGTMYMDRDRTNCWSASDVISEFDTWQEQFPEELWRLDIRRKYIRTYEAGTPRFLKEMMNGRKKYQRRQFERNQDPYIGSKYLSTRVTSDQIMFRCNTPSNVVVAPDYTLRIVPYSDMYVSVMYGNASAQQVRAKAGEEVRFTSSFTDANETTVLIYLASRIQALNDLSTFYIHDNDFSNASRLKLLKIGNSTTGYSNAFLTTLNVNRNTLLETLDVRNCPNLTGSLSLAACPNLKELYLEGTAIRSIVFATNGKIQIAHLPRTVNSLTMRYLNYISELTFASYANLLQLVSEYCAYDPYSIIYPAIDNLQIVTARGIDWTFSDTVVLNKLYSMGESVLSGKVTITGAIRQSEIDNYHRKWPDLDVYWDENMVVQQFVVRYLNWDGEELGSTKVDIGNAPPNNPLELGIIQATPTREPDKQYVYTHSGWEGIENRVYSNTSVTALFSTQTRTYTVSWYDREGDMVPHDVKTVPYGGEAVTDVVPTDYSLEGTLGIYRVFKGWKQSTGYVENDMAVYADWEEAYYPPDDKPLNEMTCAEIYAISRRRGGSEYGRLGKSNVGNWFLLEMGNDYEFENAVPTVLLKDRYFDGTDQVATDIQLFSADAPSFTMVIDYEFDINSPNDSVLVSCRDRGSGDGFALSYYLYGQNNTSSNYSRVVWSTQDPQRVGKACQRNIICLRHAKGSSVLNIHSFNGMSSSSVWQVYDISQANFSVTAVQAPATNAYLTFGALRSDSSGQTTYQRRGVGMIHLAKIWYADLGATIGKELAAWPHETVKMRFAGWDRQKLAGTSEDYANLSFYADSLLPMALEYSQSGLYTLNTWNGSKIQKFYRERIAAGLPRNWRSAISPVTVVTSEGVGRSGKDSVTETVYPPAYGETVQFSDGSSEYNQLSTESAGYISELFGTIQQRLKWAGIVLEDRDYNVEGRRFITSYTDPADNQGITLKDGDVWYYTGSPYIRHVFISNETASKHSKLGHVLKSNASWSKGAEIQIAYDGIGYWVRAVNWWTRSPSVSTSNYFYAFRGDNYYSTPSFGAWNYSNQYYLLFGFSV